MVKKNHATHQNNEWPFHENKEAETVQIVLINISQSNTYRKDLCWLLIKRTHSLFLVHLNVYQETHQTLKLSTNKLYKQVTTKEYAWNGKMCRDRFRKRKDG